MRMYAEMMQVYGMYGQRILQEVQRNGPSRIKHADVKCLHVFKRETLHLLEIYVDKAAQDGATCRKEIVKEMVGQVLQPILTDYRQASSRIQSARGSGNTRTPGGRGGSFMCSTLVYNYVQEERAPLRGCCLFS